MIVKNQSLDSITSLLIGTKSVKNLLVKQKQIKKEK